MATGLFNSVENMKFTEVTSLHLDIQSDVFIPVCTTLSLLHLHHTYTCITLQCSVVVSVPTQRFPCSVGQCTKVHSTRLENDPDMWLVFRGTYWSYTRLDNAGGCVSITYHYIRETTYIL